MIREVGLTSYLPPFMAEYKEINAALTAEDPEFRLLWNAADRVLQNEFIETADEYGIGRFEKLLGILPSIEDTTESRRSRVRTRWFTELPYTWRMFLHKLTALCAENDFLITGQLDDYRVGLEVHLELYGEIGELELLIEKMFPCNMVADIRNNILIEAQGEARTGGGLCLIRQFFITNDSKDKVTVRGTALHGGSFINSVKISVTGDI